MNSNSNSNPTSNFFSCPLFNPPREKITSRSKEIKYIIGDEIGSGNFGTVYSGKSNETGEPVVIKKLTHNVQWYSASRELACLCACDHPNIISLLYYKYYVDHDGSGKMIFVFPRYHYDLSKVIFSAQKLDVAHRVVFLYQILLAIQHLHSLGWIHRDIKPANMLVDANCHLTLCDFGMARPVYDLSAKPFEDITRYTVTRWYRPPEIMLDLLRGKPIDMWSIGCVLAELILRKPLFEGASELDMLTLIFTTVETSGVRNYDWISNKKAKDYVERIPNKGSGNLQQRLREHGASKEECDLVVELLNVDPNKRINADDALKKNLFNVDIQILRPPKQYWLPPGKKVVANDNEEYYKLERAFPVKERTVSEAVQLEFEIRAQHFISRASDLYPCLTKPSPVPVSEVPASEVPVSASASEDPASEVTASGVTASEVTASGVTASEVTASVVTASGVTASGVTASEDPASEVTASGVTVSKVFEVMNPSASSLSFFNYDNRSRSEERSPRLTKFERDFETIHHNQPRRGRSW